MTYQYRSKDGLAQSNDPHLIDTWDQICADQVSADREWIKDLRSQGIKGAHPDDGWVDRAFDYVELVYPQFNDGIEAGDKIALGWANKYRIVKVTEVVVRTSILFIKILYYFEDLPDQS